MPPRPRPTCVVCQHQTSKYACTSCRDGYCSVTCYKQHKGPSRHPASNSDSAHPHPHPDTDSQPLQDRTPLRPLTALKWPYIPDTSAFPDPLTRDDPKALQLHQYEAIATSQTIRTLLSDPSLHTRLIAIDALRGAEREAALQRALGVDGRLLNHHDGDANVTLAATLDKDTRALRALAEAVEGAVRGGREDVMGLDWD
ncbi:hypothetical protein HD554DRAFT_2302239 [Boletus coccyginus]|nr:hypothetical protein HD554DRAFT_2302239 [Boletus coccyginus]